MLRIARRILGSLVVLDVFVGLAALVLVACAPTAAHAPEAPRKAPAVTAPTVVTPEPSAEAVLVETLAAEYECSPSGLPEGVVPAHAVIRTVSGEIRLVSFDRGWEVLKGNRPGDLLAVCAK